MPTMKKKMMTGGGAEAKCFQFKSLSFSFSFFLIATLQGPIVFVHGNTTPFASCSQVPYPELCVEQPSWSNPLDAGEGTVEHLGFRQLNFQAATNRFQDAYLTTLSTNITSLDPLSREAWSDCSKLSQETIEFLERSITFPSNDDSQTWLSAAIANYQTCLDGFLEFNLSTPLLFSTNLTKFLSNSLAINKADMLSLSSGGNNRRRRLLGRGPFPEWVLAADRRLLQSPNVTADIVVAKDGSGNFKTINEAVKAIKTGGSTRFVVYVKAGVYSENVEITKSMTNVMFVGDGIDRTVVTGSRNVVDGSTTFRSATFATVGDGFIARDMTFENTAGPQKHQAVALRSGADKSVFYRCSFKGYQDTLYVHSQRQFYRDCDVYGTVDFIFGDSAVVLQNCKIFCRQPKSGQKNTVTAQGRSDPNENTGISIHNSVVAEAGSLVSVNSYLGRPWKEYSRTVFMKCNIGGLIAPEGWLEWSGSFALKTLYYGEYANTGAGAATGGRVKWPGYRVITSAIEAVKFTVGSFLSGSSWIPASGVPFTPGL